MVKVAMVTPWGKNVRCGIRTYSEDLACALVDIGVDIYIIRIPRFGLKIPGILNNIVESIPKEGVELIHVQHEYGLYQSLEGGFYGDLKQLGLPIVTTMHAIGNFTLDSVICSASDRVITHNEFCDRRLGHPSVIIPHGCKSSKCVPEAKAKQSYNLSHDWPIVGYLGFISEYKGLEILIEAMEGIPDAGLLICGGWHVESETHYILQLKQRTWENLKDRAQWLGYIPDGDLPRAYGSMNVVVYPSRFATESGALLNALGYGKAVIANKIPPFEEKENVGALMTFSDLDDLREKIELLLGNEDARRKLEAGARKYTEENSWNKVSEKHLELYKHILNLD